MSPGEALARFLADAGVGEFAGEDGWSINYAVEPSSPDDAVTVYETGGPGLDTDELDEQPSIQIRARSHSMPNAYAKLREIQDLLVLPEGPVDASGVVFSGIWSDTGILPIGRDDAGRHLVVVNFRTRLERV